MANPVEEFLLKKEALGPATSTAGRFGKKLVEGGGLGLAFAGMSVGVAGTIAAANSLYNAATKTRDFNRMLEANPHLVAEHERDPEGFGRMFSSIRAMNPEFSKDPLVAGSFMFEAMAGAPQDRGFVAAKTRRDMKTHELGPASDAAMSGFRSGIGMKLEGPQSLMHGSHGGGHDGADTDTAPAY